MPTYEYSCEKCGSFEIWQSIKDNALGVCPTCGSKVHRLISANVGFVLKGSGFYQNDYKNTPTVPVKTPGPTKVEEKPKGDIVPGCGACGSPDPCPSGNN